MAIASPRLWAESEPVTANRRCTTTRLQSVLFHMDSREASTRYRTWRRSRGNRLPEGAYASGRPIHAIVCARRGTAPFRERSLAQRVFAEACAPAEVLASCLMPDHLHWLLRDAATARERVARLKSQAVRWWWQTGGEGTFWQRSFWDSCPRGRRRTIEMAHYIVRNPVRAGLVENWRRYPYTFLHADLGGPELGTQPVTTAHDLESR